MTPFTMMLTAATVVLAGLWLYEAAQRRRARRRAEALHRLLRTRMFRGGTSRS